MVKHAAFMRRKEKGKVEAPAAPSAPAPAPEGTVAAPTDKLQNALKRAASWGAPAPKPTGSGGAAAPRLPKKSSWGAPVAKKSASWAAALGGTGKPKLSWSQLGGASKDKANNVILGEPRKPKRSWGSTLGKEAERASSEESPRSVVGSPVQSSKEASSLKRGWGDAIGQPTPKKLKADPESCVVLACKYDTPRQKPECADHVRLDALQKLYPSFRVVGCSEYRPSAKAMNAKSGKADDVIMGQAKEKDETHISANFKKTLKEILRGRNPKILMLDYFWLQPGYYEQRYGMNFLQSSVDSNVGSKIRELFISHQCQVMLLPCDSRGSVTEMYEASFDDRPDCVCIEFVSEVDALKHHPLVRATRHIDDELRALADRVQHSKGRWHEMQMLRLANPQPFLVAYRRGLDWRRYLDERCILGEASQPSLVDVRPPPILKRKSSVSPPPEILDVSSDDEPVGVLLNKPEPVKFIPPSARYDDVSSDDEPVGFLA